MRRDEEECATCEWYSCREHADEGVCHLWHEQVKETGYCESYKDQEEY